MAIFEPESTSVWSDRSAKFTTFLKHYLPLSDSHYTTAAAATEQPLT